MRICHRHKPWRQGLLQYHRFGRLCDRSDRKSGQGGGQRESEGKRMGPVYVKLVGGSVTMQVVITGEEVEEAGLSMYRERDDGCGGEGLGDGDSGVAKSC